MESIATPKKPWKLVVMDFIVKLPRLKDPTTQKEYDSILTTTDQLTKEAKFIPTNKATEASETAHLVVKEIVATEGLPDEWITDRDPKFISHF
jgi:hypothetical protein